MPLAKAIAWQTPRIFTFEAGPNAAILLSPNCAIFISDGDYELQSVTEIHETAGTDAGAVTLDVVKCTGTQAAAAGTTMLVSTFNLKSAANTVVTKARAGAGLSTTRPNTQVRKGDRVSLKFTGVFTALTGVCVTITMTPILRRQNW